MICVFGIKCKYSFFFQSTLLRFLSLLCAKVWIFRKIVSCMLLCLYMFLSLSLSLSLNLYHLLWVSYSCCIKTCKTAEKIGLGLGFHKDRPRFGQPDRTETVGQPKRAFDGLGPDSVRSTDIFGPGPNEKKKKFTLAPPTPWNWSCLPPAHRSSPRDFSASLSLSSPWPPHSTSPCRHP